MNEKELEGLKTSELLDKLNEELDDTAFDEVITEFNARFPFSDIDDHFDGLEKYIDDLKEEIQGLRNNMRSHTHLASGKSVKEI